MTKEYPRGFSFAYDDIVRVELAVRHHAKPHGPKGGSTIELAVPEGYVQFFTDPTAPLRDKVRVEIQGEYEHHGLARVLRALADDIDPFGPAGPRGTGTDAFGN